MSEEEPDTSSTDKEKSSSVRSLFGRGRLTALSSAVALVFSTVSFYESALKRAELEIYVPPVIHSARDGGGDVELFAIPVTITNGGARTGTVLSMDLEVENPKATADQPKSKHYYSAYLGEHSKNADALNRAFAPASIAGRTTYSETVRFYPAGNPLPKLVDEAGEYRFTLTLNLAEAAEAGFWDSIWRPRIAPLKFALNLPWISEQQLGFRRLAIAMHAKDYKPISAGQTASK